MEKHEYQAPGPNDSRSPCPALNSLANHGYLPRNGKNITANQLIEAINEGFNVSKFIAFILSHAGSYLIGKTREGELSLEDLFNDAIEHPVSLTRPDKDLSEDYRKISPELLDSLFSEKNENNKLTRKSFARQFIKRRDQSLRDNSKFHGLSFLQKYQVFGEYSLTLLCFPGSENGRGEEIDVDTLKSIYQFERFPDNWKKSESTIDLSQLHNLVGDIRDMVEDLDKNKPENMNKILK
ncbi:unnamed protein product [Rhizophagus irregularis]|uniref:Cloroperoxidase n=1 Tax=Rhizophagus irregularis TaxID=588596 RepID=A0A2N1NLT2_9GLOM|nr:Cloroperoxidase [Rhizophagus irregularis]CAB4377291.1 unnamed protein product [Rhizophagus irregularis]CAB5383431.1 unnamed protein product [Rhizophagus irregularis]